MDDIVHESRGHEREQRAAPRKLGARCGEYVVLAVAVVLLCALLGGMMWTIGFFVDKAFGILGGLLLAFYLGVWRPLMSDDD